MEILNLRVITFLFIVSEAFAQTNDCSKDHSHNHGHHGRPMTGTCMGKQLRIPEGFNDTMRTCREKVFGPIDETKPRKEFDPKHFWCMVLCQAQENDLINESGQLQIDDIGKLIEESMPTDAVASLTDEVKNCIKEFGTEVKVTKGDCSSIEPIFHCFKNAMKNICWPNVSSSPPSPNEKKE